MKILIITESIPFPAHNGRELPLEGIFSILCSLHTIHLVVYGTEGQNKKNITAIPEKIQFKGFLIPRRWSNGKRILQTIKTLRYTMSPFEYSKNEITKLITENDYDFLWISPVSYHGFVTFCKKKGLNFFRKTALGLNDSKTYLYRDQINEITKTGIFNTGYFIHWIQSFLIKRGEKKYLLNADLVHVQTQHENDKIQKIINHNSKPKIVVASNGVKEELFNCRYTGVDSENILLMTHLDGGRSEQSKWFIQKIWSVVHTKLPRARLLIIGKPPAQKLPWINTSQNITVHGYASNLTDIFNSVRLAVVPTFHGTGFINRIADALAAGVPVISTPQAIATFTDIQTGTHILAASNAKDFANTITNLYNNREKRLSIGNYAKLYAMRFATWDLTAKTVEKAMQELL